MAAVVAIIGCTDTAVSASAHARSSRHARPVRKPAPHRVTRPALIGVGNVPGCMIGSAAGLPVLGAYHASIVRVVIDPTHGENGEAQGCLSAAVVAGDKVHVAIGYSNLWNRAQIVAYFRRELSLYGRYAWAISIGNEQELNQGGTEATAKQYAAVWRAVEPVVARAAPHAIRVAGEISPWGINFLRGAYAARLPGAQAIAAHAYKSRYGFDLPKVVAWVRRTHLPLWITEGLDGPNAWPSNIPTMHAVPLSSLSGAVVADAWLD